MNDRIILDKDIDPGFVRSQFDEILVKEITSLIEIDSEIAMLTYNLSTISAIIIAVDREREIRNTKIDPPSRFTFESLISELVDIGLYSDDAMLKSVKSVIDQGYLTQNIQGGIKAEVSAYTIVGFLDKMFPGMQGIQLIAFVIQMCDEVISERKSLENAKYSFEHTLRNSGVSVTREKAEKKARELEFDDSETHNKMKEVALKLKEDNIKRLAQLRFKQKLSIKAGGKPSFHFNGGSRLDKVKITSVFNSGPTQEEIEAEKKAKEEAERLRQEALLRAAQLEEREKKLREAEEAAKEIEKKAVELAAKEKALKEAEMASLRLEQQQAELRAKEAEMAAREAELKLREEQLKAAAQREAAAKREAVEKAEAEKAALEKEEAARAEQELIKARRQAELESEQADKIDQSAEEDENQLEDTDDDIESRIAAFEAELTIPCPLCKKGSIKKEETDAGKEYFICSDKNCRFVSWSQPYHFSCPLCKNTFLVEFQTSSETKGLKCPRASCTFSQNHLFNPAQNPASQNNSFQDAGAGNFSSQQQGQQTQAAAESPKKKRLVRRVKRKS